MWYIVLARDNPGTLAHRLAARSAHLARLHELLAQGRLKLAGPIPAVDGEDSDQAGFSGSLLVVQFPSLAEASAWADADPYIAAGVYRSVEILPFKPVLP